MNQQLNRRHVSTLVHLVLLAAILSPLTCVACISDSIQSRAQRSRDASNLKEIMMASLIYAQAHNDQLPVATDIWDYARLLAESAGLDDARIWQSHIDPAADSNTSKTNTILTPPRVGLSRNIESDFRQLKPSFAVTLGTLNNTMPATTPIAWTRGLQPNGRWAKHSPYGDSGGWITFIGGNVAFYKNLNEDGGQLTRFNGKGKTANIFEALPPGVRIGEYQPTAEEQTAWAKEIESQNLRAWLQGLFPLFIILIIWVPFVFIAIYRRIKKRGNSAKVFLTPVILTCVLVAIMSLLC